MHARAAIWRGIGGGLLLSLQAYRTYILPLAGFVAQLRDLPQSWPSHEQRLMVALCPGARGWATPCFLQQLKSLGFAGEFANAQAMAATVTTNQTSALAALNVSSSRWRRHQWQTTVPSDAHLIKETS